MSKYKVFGTTYLFSEDYRLEKLIKHGDPLERLNEVVNWEYFQITISNIFKKNDKFSDKTYVLIALL